MLLELIVTVLVDPVPLPSIFMVFELDPGFIMATLIPQELNILVWEREFPEKTNVDPPVFPDAVLNPVLLDVLT